MKSCITLLRELRRKRLSSDVTKQMIDGHEIADVTLPPEIMDLATRLASEMAARVKKDHIGSVIDEEGFNDLHAHEIGAQGEFAFARYAFGDWKQALEYMENALEKPDNTFREYTIDVKTRRRCEINSWLLVSENQWRRKQYDFYIGCSKEDTNVVRIWGFATKEEIEKAEHADLGHGMNLVVEFGKLHPIREMLEFPVKS